MQQYGPSHPLVEDHPGAPPRLMKLLEQSLRAIAEQVACARVGLWLFNPHDEADSLRCLARYDAASQQMQAGPRHDIAAGGRGLFEALSREAHAVDDTRSSVLRGLSLEPTPGPADAPAARMASAFSLNGRLLGALICSHPNSASGWSPRQRVSLTRASASVALSLSRDGEAAFSALVEHQGDAA